MRSSSSYIFWIRASKLSPFQDINVDRFIFCAMYLLQTKTLIPWFIKPAVGKHIFYFLKRMFCTKFQNRLDGVLYNLRIFARWYIIASFIGARLDPHPHASPKGAVGAPEHVSGHHRHQV